MFHPDMRLLRCFAAIADSRSVTRAGEQLNLTQSTVSGQLKELEASIGFPLFHRTTRSLRLTEHGERILPLVHAVLAQTETLCGEVQAMQKAGASRFRLGAAMYCLDLVERADLLEAFGEARPDIAFVVDNRLQSDQIPSLLDGGLDVALLLGIPDADAKCEPRTGGRPQAIVNETVYPACLDRVLLARRSIGLLVPAHLPLAGLPSIGGEALRGQRVMTLSIEHGRALVDPIQDFFARHGADLVHGAEGNALAIAREAARRGICAVGTGWFPPPPGLVFRDVDGIDLHLDFSVVLGTYANKAAQLFFAFARQRQARGHRAAPSIAAACSPAPVRPGERISAA